MYFLTHVLLITFGCQLFKQELQKFRIELTMAKPYALKMYIARSQMLFKVR